jgi:hypothetical protein
MIGFAAALALLGIQPEHNDPRTADSVAVPQSEAEAEAQLTQISRRLDRLEVRITTGRQLLWSGTVDVNRMAPASYSENRMNAVAPDCPELRQHVRVGHELSFEAYKYGGNATDPDHYRFTVTWQRHFLADDCRNTGTQSVRLEQHSDLGPGETFVLRGDGDLVVEISRPPVAPR